MLPIARALLAAVACALTAACTPISMFATLAPQDHVPRQAAGVAYGPAPRQKLDVYAPPGGGEARPVAVFFYGGSWSAGRRQDYAWVGRSLAAQGFVTVVPDYRLYPEVRFPEFLNDGAAALRWVADHGAAYGGDPERIVLVGHSAGAYIAVMLALDPRYLRDAGVEPRRVKAAAGLAGPYDFLPLRGKATTRIFAAAADLARTQPVALARPDAPAMFLATGADDRVVGPHNTRTLARLLRGAGVSVDERVYPDMAHSGAVLGLSRAFRGRSSLRSDLARFLHAHTDRPAVP